MLRPQHQEQVTPETMLNNCILLLHMNGQNGTSQFIDSSNNPKVVTTYGNAALSNAHYRFGGTSGYFDGTGDYLQLADSDDFNFGSGSMTLSCWLKLGATTEQRIFGQYDGTNYWGLYYNITSDHKFHFYGYGAGLTNNCVDSTNTYSDTSVWYHYAIVKNGNSITQYINGTADGTGTCTAGFPDVASPLTIGRWYNITGVDFNGYIDEFAVWKGVALPIGMLYSQKRPFGYPVGGT